MVVYSLKNFLRLFVVTVHSSYITQLVALHVVGPSRVAVAAATAVQAAGGVVLLRPVQRAENRGENTVQAIQHN